MKNRQLKHDSTAGMRCLALTLILFGLATVISSQGGGVLLPSAQAMHEGRQLQHDSKSQPTQSGVDLLYWQFQQSLGSPALNFTGEQPKAQQTIKVFNIDIFEQNLKAQLDSKTVGYSYAIFDGIQLKKAGAGGYAILKSVPQSPDKRMATMSMGKTITATAVMKAIEELRAQGKQISIDSRIAPFLPGNWKLGPHVNELTFRHLLTHTSGLRPADSDPDTFSGLQQTIARGAKDADFGKPEYANANFCLFRIIIPYMTSSSAALRGMEAVNPSLLPLTTGNMYVGYVQQHVLNRAGLSGVSVIPTGSLPYVRYYNFGNTMANFADVADDRAILRTGAGYWYMSVKEFARFIASLRNGKIVSPDTFKLMKENKLGMYSTESEFGTYWDHNGSYERNDGAGSQADWMIFPNGVTAVILINSTGGLGKPPEQVVRTAFNKAW